ncbi:hypothetical protein C8A05DRAFT_20243 [Staphylotrichum tortipilum]|uniref:N-acetyltransferase domain-containing protein n=1 Tax=Staphylotrichum tortipilum TaxID=2831512 RepID=A0AAN6RMH5_9PEZI|nr:hypothetical protein C8A05DRAFT_20243 [Staphylotrichum longicolle]
MDAPKRTRSPAESEICGKKAKTSHESGNVVAGQLPGRQQQHGSEVQVRVKLRSTSKAIRNDPYYWDNLSASAFAEWKWLEQIDGVGDVDHHQVAYCDAKLIRRQHIKSAFWAEMEGPSEETSDLAFELFDRYGRLNREHYDHEMGKGSGVWGQELDHGDILLFESLSVETIWRHQGIGTKLVKAVLDKVRAKSCGFFAFAQPGYLTAELPSADKEGNSEMARKLLAVSKLFWISLGFRRVGTSGWFAFTDDAQHPSRRLEAAQDWDEPEWFKEEEPIPGRMHTLLCTLADPSTLDVECVRQIQEALPVEATALARPYTDESGNTILHIAALVRKPETISYLLAKYPRLADMRNARGHTPLDVLQGSLEEYRTRRHWGGATAVISDNFGGFSASDLACLAALTDTIVFDLAKVSTQDISAISSATDREAGRIRDASTIRHTLRLKYGCTCGECIGGFLSPRMRFALLCQAELQHDMLRADLHGSGPDWVAMNGVALRHLTAPVRQNLETNKSMRQGFTNMCHHIARCLRERRLPDEETVLRLFRDGRGEWPPVTKHYFQRGGTVAAVATMLFDQAMHQDEWAGDGVHLESHQEEIGRLPVCRNDHEFGFVSGMCGYKRVSVV